MSSIKNSSTGMGRKHNTNLDETLNSEEISGDFFFKQNSSFC